MGDAESVPCDLNHVHRPEASLLRTVLGLLIMVLGFVGIIGAMDGGLVRTLNRLTDVLGLGQWYDEAQVALHWAVDRHLGGRVLFLLLLVGVSFLVGYVARRRGRVCALLPIVSFYGLATLGALVFARGEVRLSVSGTAEYGTYVLALLAGAHLGVQLARSMTPYRRPLFALLAVIAGAVPALGWIDIVLTLRRAASPVLLRFLLLASILTLSAWVLAMVVRRAYHTRV